jgi:hypothetical protein
MAHDGWPDQIEAETARRCWISAKRFLATPTQVLGVRLEAIARKYATDLAHIEAVCPCGRRLARRCVDAKAIWTLHTP